MSKCKKPVSEHGPLTNTQTRKPDPTLIDTPIAIVDIRSAYYVVNEHGMAVYGAVAPDCEEGCNLLLETLDYLQITEPLHSQIEGRLARAVTEMRHGLILDVQVLAFIPGGRFVITGFHRPPVVADRGTESLLILVANPAKGLAEFRAQPSHLSILRQAEAFEFEVPNVH